MRPVTAGAHICSSPGRCSQKRGGGEAREGQRARKLRLVQGSSAAAPGCAGLAGTLRGEGQGRATFPGDSVLEPWGAGPKPPLAPSPAGRVIDGPPQGPGDRCPRPPRAGARPGRVRPGERPGRRRPSTPFLPFLIVLKVPGCSFQVRRVGPGPSGNAGDREWPASQAWPRFPASASGIPGAAPLRECTKGAPRPGCSARSPRQSSG